MLITRARTRASARGRRLLADSQAGLLVLQPKVLRKCYTITAPRPSSFRFMPLNPQVQGRLHHVYPRGLRAATPVTL